ncbi:MAG TPA: hypothetical protein VIL99_08980 [Ignavibacteria bacterium]
MILLIFATFLIISCGNDSKKTSSDTNKNETVDKWGGATRDSWVEQITKSNILDDIIIAYGLQGSKEYEYRRLIAGCEWDKETAYLEKTYGNNPPEKGVNYRYKIHKGDEFLMECVKEIVKNKKK